jgi:hypothetical protein
MRPVILLIPCLVAAPAFAETCGVAEGPERPIHAAKLYVEDNAGDRDIGVHGIFDDEGWTELCVFDPAGSLILHYLPANKLADLGLAEVFFESFEPPYAQWDYKALTETFPEGDYSLRAQMADGSVATGAAKFTTVVPLPPKILTPVTVPEPDQGPLPTVAMADLEVKWEPVTESRDGRPVTIRGYELWINKENHTDENGNSRPNFDVHLGPGATSFVVPKAFFDPASVYEIEVLAIEESGNQTIGGASFFATE